MRIRGIGWLALPAGLAMIAAACGGGSSSSKTPTPAPTATAAQTVAGAAAPSDTVKLGQSSKLGQILTNSSGRTIYVFFKDKAGSNTSACTGTCANVWPPLTAPPSGTPTLQPGVPGTLSVVSRPDGTKQVAYNGQPLYIYSGDSAPGDTNGEGILNVWFAARAGTQPMTSPPTAAPGASTGSPSASGTSATASTASGY